MNIKRILQKLIIAFVGIFVLSLPALAQPSLKAGKKDNKPATAAAAAEPVVSPTPEAGVKNDPLSAEEVQEDAYITTMYTNSIMRDYKLGPEDVISVEVFGQCPNYCKMNVTVPP